MRFATETRLALDSAEGAFNALLAALADCIAEIRGWCAPPLWRRSAGRRRTAGSWPGTQCRCLSWNPPSGQRQTEECRRFITQVALRKHDCLTGARSIIDPIFGVNTHSPMPLAMRRYFVRPGGL